MKKNTSFISNELYEEIHKVTPIPCVDLVVRQNGRFLMLMRKNKPAQNEWWLPGGRIHKGETLDESAKRKLLEETGVEAEKLTCLGADETFFDDGPFDDPTHSINVIFAADINDNAQISLDDQSSDFKWFNFIDSGWHEYIKKVLTSAGFKQK